MYFSFSHHIIFSGYCSELKCSKMKSCAFKLLMETTLFCNMRYLKIRLITNQDERIYDYSSGKYVHMFYNREIFSWMPWWYMLTFPASL